MQDLIITNSGEELVSKLIAGTATAVFTRIAASDRDYSGVDLKGLAELESVKQTVLISEITQIDTTLIEIVAAMDNSKLQSGYYTRALGVYAEDSDGNEILFGVSIETESPFYLPTFGGKTVSSITYTFKVKVDNSEQVKIEVNPGAYVTVEQFAHDIAKHISGAVEVSGNAVPAVGVKTHYFVVKNILNYATPVFSGAVDGVLDTGTGEVRGFLQDGKSILPMAILTE